MRTAPALIITVDSVTSLPYDFTYPRPWCESLKMGDSDELIIPLFLQLSRSLLFIGLLCPHLLLSLSHLHSWLFSLFPKLYSKVALALMWQNC